jgi:8-oxo-dGTP diphosphatase
MLNNVQTRGIRVIASVISKDSKFLVCLRPNHKRHGGLWEFPGGKFQDRESPLDAARRELAEELHVEVLSVGNLLFSEVDPGSPYRIDFFYVDITGTPQTKEHQEIRWCSIEELSHLPLAPADGRFLKEFLWKQH